MSTATTLVEVDVSPAAPAAATDDHHHHHRQPTPAHEHRRPPDARQSHPRRNGRTRPSPPAPRHPHDDLRHAHNDHHHHHHHHPHHPNHQRAHAGHDHAHAACDHDHADGWRKFLPHSHGLEARLKADTRSLQAALAILVFAFVIQLVGGYLANSSVLVLEAVHSALDGITVAISLLSVTVATRAPTARYTYGFARAEVVSALVSVIALALLCVKLFVGAVVNLAAIVSGSHARREVEGRIIMLAEGITLAANIFIALVLTRGSATLNIRALRAHVIADSIENLVVLAAGLVISLRKDWSIIDPILTLVIVVVIVLLNWGIAREAVSVLLQATPDGVDLEADIIGRISAVAGVGEIGPVHLWTLTAGSVVASAVVYVDDNVAADGFQAIERVRREVHAVLRKAGVSEITVQVCQKDAHEEVDKSDSDESQCEGKKGLGTSRGYFPVAGEDQV